jgi:glyoxylase-like metal-dependent hydrolase (beta-lactamase superfamily II)
MEPDIVASWATDAPGWARQGGTDMGAGRIHRLAGDAVRRGRRVPDRDRLDRGHEPGEGIGLETPGRRRGEVAVFLEDPGVLLVGIPRLLACVRFAARSERLQHADGVVAPPRDVGQV